MGVTISLIAAVAENGVIGVDRGLPWRLPSDFAFFKRMTMGKPIVMGRKTFESIGKPLPGRTNIVVSRQPTFRPEGVEVAADLDAALARAAEVAETTGVDEVMVIGGAVLYKTAIERADRLYITHVALSPEGDARFPLIDPEVWQVVARPDAGRGENDSAAFTVAVYERRNRTASH